MVATRPRSESGSEVSRSHITDEHNSGEGTSFILPSLPRTRPDPFM
jgi:hypothetical protein